MTPSLLILSPIWLTLAWIAYECAQEIGWLPESKANPIIWRLRFGTMRQVMKGMR